MKVAGTNSWVPEKDIEKEKDIDKDIDIRVLVSFNGVQRCSTVFNGVQRCSTCFRRAFLPMLLVKERVMTREGRARRGLVKIVCK